MNDTTLLIIMAQLNFLVGDIPGNCQKILCAIDHAKKQHQADLIVFPELALTGYPPEDLLLREDLYEQIDANLKHIQAATNGITVILGYPYQEKNKRYNRAICIQNQTILTHYDKQCLPNYGVFDEQRYFTPGHSPCSMITLKNLPVSISICEDLWFPQPMIDAKAAGARLMISLNASPFSLQKAEKRQQMLAQRTREGNMPILYVNCVGGQDELVFDGGSMVMDAEGKRIQQADFFTEGLYPVKISIVDHKPVLEKKYIPVDLSEEALLYNALMLGVRDYVNKNNFNQVFIGLSGGIDSALTLAIAVDAIGKDRVNAIIMPSRFTADISLIDAQMQINALGVASHQLSIEPLLTAFLETLTPVFSELPPDSTEENIQARCRGTLLMALANKYRGIVLTTSNKSETAVGYATLYGDMAGGFCVLKDVFKTWVYRLAIYRNQQFSVIPERVITRPPSAELAENQLDQDHLPPYPILDEILKRYIEQDESATHIIQAGFDQETVLKILSLVQRNEYKRRQAPPGVRVTERAFGKDRRYPITSGFHSFFCSSNT